MFDISWAHLAVIAAVALVVIGPKDLPRVLRTAGQWMARARAVAREFQNSLDQMVREAELDEMRRDLQKATEFDIEKEFNKTIDPDGKLAESMRPDIPDHFDESPKTIAAPPEPELEPELPLGAPGEARAAEPATPIEAVEAPQTPLAEPDASLPAREPTSSKT